MEWQDILQSIGSLGFSIVVAIWALKFCFDTITKLNEKITAQLADLTSAVNANTLTLTKLVEKLDDK